MYTVFLSYRRQDSADICDRLNDRLRRRYGTSHVFRDASAILAGSEFPTALRQALDECRVVLVLIGPTWLDARDALGRRRLEDPSDWVRVEIATALRAGKKVVPVLVRGARMPSAAELPEDLRGLVERQPGVVRSDPYFDGDVESLYRLIGREGVARLAHVSVLALGIATALGLAITYGFGFAHATALAALAAQITLVVVLITFPLEVWFAVFARRWAWLSVCALHIAAFVGFIAFEYTHLKLWGASQVALCALPILFGSIGPVRVRSNLHSAAHAIWWRVSVAILTFSGVALGCLAAAIILAMLRIHGTFGVAVALLVLGLLLPVCPWLLALGCCVWGRQWRWLIVLALYVVVVEAPLTIVAVSTPGPLGLALVCLPEVLLLALLLRYGWMGRRQGMVAGQPQAALHDLAGATVSSPIMRGKR